jgi:hypothetical protein
MSDIQTEYGGSNPINLSEYYGKGNAPSSGDNLQISQFEGTANDAHTLIATATASASATLDITSGIDSTYDVYQFVFTNMHPATNESEFTFQVNAAGASGFNETITSTYFRAYHLEGGGSTAVGYSTGGDQAQGTAYQMMSQNIGSDADQSCSGMLTLYAPSSTTFVKHFMSRVQESQHNDYSLEVHAAGYINTTSAIDAISFKFDSGNIDAGVIKMYGVAKS